LAQVWLETTSSTNVTVGVPAQLSLAVTLDIEFAGTLAAQETVTATGQVTVGGVWSLTVIVCEQVAELPQTSVARYVRVTVKRLAQVWPETTSSTKVTVGVPAQLSLAFTLDTLFAGTFAAQETVTATGQVTVGGVWSLTVIVCAQVAELPQTSVAR
jgi:nitrogen fixation protein